MSARGALAARLCRETTSWAFSAPWASDAVDREEVGKCFASSADPRRISTDAMTVGSIWRTSNTAAWSSLPTVERAIAEVNV